jgi:hypothetical protein
MTAELEARPTKGESAESGPAKGLDELEVRLKKAMSNLGLEADLLLLLLTAAVQAVISALQDCDRPTDRAIKAPAARAILRGWLLRSRDYRSLSWKERAALVDAIWSVGQSCRREDSEALIRDCCGNIPGHAGTGGGP